MSHAPQKTHKLQKKYRLDGVLTALAIGCVLSASPMVDFAKAETAAEAAKKPVVPPSPARLPDGHPNWTGFWASTVGLLDKDLGLGGSKPGSAPPASGLFMDYADLKPPYDKQEADFMAKLVTGKVEDPVALCYPPGFPRMMVMVYGMEFLQVPGEIVITSEWGPESRRIWLNRDKHIDEDIIAPSYGGDSIGHWEGDTLVVDTVGIGPKVPLNFTGLPHSDKLHVTEKWTQIKPGIIQDVITINDPVVFEEPWSETETYRYRPDLALEEFVCEDNNRNVGAGGEATFK